jgi:hypothetical protein
VFFGAWFWRQKTRAGQTTDFCSLAPQTQDDQVPKQSYFEEKHGFNKAFGQCGIVKLFTVAVNRLNQPDFCLSNGR